jgi:hypothetical protein
MEVDRSANSPNKEGEEENAIYRDKLKVELAVNLAAIEP